MNLIKQKLNYESILYGLLFLFPLFAIGVRHWTSNLFGLLILLGFVYFVQTKEQDRIQLHKYERIYLWLFVIYFIVFLISMAVNFPEKFSLTRFDKELRTLLIIPLYFLLAAFKDNFRYLALGGGLAVVIAVGFCVHDLQIKGLSVFRGEYSQLYTGPILVIYTALFLAFYLTKPDSHNTRNNLIVLIIIIIGLSTVIYTGVRGAYVCVFALTILFPVLFSTGWKRYITLLLLLAVSAGVFFSSDIVKQRFNASYAEIHTYIKAENKADPENSKVNTSAGTRLEMWRSSIYYLRDYPVFGAGNGNYDAVMQKFIDQKLVHPLVLQHGHPHNVFVNALMTKGVPGFILVVLIYFFPLYVYIKTRKVSKGSADIGIIYTVMITLFSLNEVAPFYKSNFQATNLLLSLVIFSYHLRAIKQKNVQ